MLDRFPELAATGIDFVDVGCSGRLDERWRPLEPLLNLVGFDPDTSDVASLSSSNARYRTARYFPFAVADRVGEATLYTTAAPHCSSLLKPNHAWLGRFAYSGLFQQTGQRTVHTVTLDHLAQTESLRADVLKLDTQGMELPILRTGEKLLAEAICVATETGFVENYAGESLASDVDAFMRQHGFLMLDMQIYRVGRANACNDIGRQQPLWCEVVWIRDFAGVSSHAELQPVSRLTAIKALVICWALDFADFGLELAQYFQRKGLLTREELVPLQDPATWQKTVQRDPIDESLMLGLRLLPATLRKRIASVAGDSVQKIHVARALWRTLTLRGK
jgi:FkbM family methyltransferase